MTKKAPFRLVIFKLSENFYWLFKVKESGKMLDRRWIFIRMMLIGWMETSIVHAIQIQAFDPLKEMSQIALASTTH